MKEFLFLAIDSKGRKISGEVEARTEEKAVAKLREQNLTKTCQNMLKIDFVWFYTV